MRDEDAEAMIATMSCETCGDIVPGSTPGVRLCDFCWEVERRMDNYLRSKAGREFVRAALKSADERWGACSQ